MTNNPNIINEPHVICFVANDGRLRAVNANPGYGLDERFAIYPNRHEANASIRFWADAHSDVTYFSVPAEVLFNKATVTKEVFTLKAAG